MYNVIEIIDVLLGAAKQVDDIAAPLRLSASLGSLLQPDFEHKDMCVGFIGFQVIGHAYISLWFDK